MGSPVELRSGTSCSSSSTPASGAGVGLASLLPAGSVAAFGQSSSPDDPALARATSAERARTASSLTRDLGPRTPPPTPPATPQRLRVDLGAGVGLLRAAAANNAARLPGAGGVDPAAVAAAVAADDGDDGDGGDGEDEGFDEGTTPAGGTPATPATGERSPSSGDGYGYSDVDEHIGRGIDEYDYSSDDLGGRPWAGSGEGDAKPSRRRRGDLGAVARHAAGLAVATAVAIALGCACWTGFGYLLARRYVPGAVLDAAAGAVGWGAALLVGASLAAASVCCSGVLAAALGGALLLCGVPGFDQFDGDEDGGGSSAGGGKEGRRRRR